MKNHEPVYLIDGSAYIYRAYHAISPLTTSTGLPTHAAYGFTTILLRVIREKAPLFLAIAFDRKGPTFRHALYSDYKANRPPMPEDLACQIPYIRKIATAYNILSLEQDGMEADDLIASAATRLAATGNRVVIVSGDKDLLQLVSEAVVVWDPMADRLMDEQAVRARYHVGPEKLNDLFGLIGDSSDNVPGVPGVGPKTAEKLINEFASMAGLYAGIDELAQPKLKEKLLAHREQAFLSRQLIALNTAVPVPGHLDAYRLPRPDEEKLHALFTELEFTRLLKREAPVRPLATAGYSLVTSRRELDTLCRRLMEKPLLVLDTETTSLDPLSARLVGISLCTEPDLAWYVPVGHVDEEGRPLADQLSLADLVECLQPLLVDDKRLIIGHNIKYDYQVLKENGLLLTAPLADTMIASYLLNPARRSHGLDDLCREQLQCRLTTFAEVTNNDKRTDAFASVPLAAARDYACEDVVATLMLWQRFEPQLRALGLQELFRDLEMPLVPLLAEMEETGILVDRQILAAVSSEFGKKLAELEVRIYALAGEEFNINSPKQLGVILFEKLRLPMGRKTKTGYSTDVTVLEKLAPYHELPAVVLEHRSIGKLKSTYADKLATLIHPRTGRVHTSFNQTVTATGRLSSSNPNLQNIPIRTQEGQRIREAFVAAPGMVLLAADYSQIDLRVLAHYSRDEALVEAFRTGRDVHAQTAAEIFRVHETLITPQMRRVAKSINFGIVYGMSAFGLAGQLNISRKEAQTFINRYFDLYRGVKRFMEEIIEEARQKGFVTTLFLRRRELPDITSSNKTVREFAERTALNTPIQGTAADIIKLASLRCHDQLRRAGLAGRLLLQIHDELVFEVAREEITATSAVIKEAMEQVVKLAVPLLVNLSHGTNLAETK